MTSTKANGSGRVLIFDTTLRDGEQSPGATMSLSSKLEIAELLQDMGVDIIEAGFPIASEGDFKAVEEISRLVRNATVCGLARSSFADIDRAGESLRPAARPRIHTFISTSALHMKYKLQMSPEDVIEAIDKSVRRARSHCDDVQWSPEDGSRTDHDFLCRAVETAIRAGASTINIPDTVGYSTPMESAFVIRMLRERVPDIDRVTLSTHCHDDLGLAVANSLAAVSAGARQIECTINGLGERAGNASLEEVVMAMRVRKDVFPHETGIDTTRIIQASRLVSRVTGFPVQFNKAIVGKNAFAHEAGIHQDGMIKHSGTYEIMRPEEVGLHESKIVLGKHSGRAAVSKKLRELGYEIGASRLGEIFRRFKHVADRKREVYDDDLVAIVQTANPEDANGVMEVEFLRVVCGTEAPQTAEIRMKLDGMSLQASATGTGPVDAAFNAVTEVFPHKARLLHYQVNAVTEGMDAQATVTVALDEDGLIVNGQSSDTDTVLASVRAYVDALNSLAMRRQAAENMAFA
ncbi:MAG: 2-isopropylmalate synthase [Rhodobacteraceae bacterium]|nr:2-isopropylmalate synthase [Paracoccaceae bacterium]